MCNWEKFQENMLQNEEIMVTTGANVSGSLTVVTERQSSTTFY